MSDTPRRYDFHTHTRRSYDCLVSPESSIRAARARGLAGIAITDHESFEGALAVQRLAPSDLLVIPGMEIYTEVGDIVCLGLFREIVSRDALTVIAETHAQGGVAFLPHPLRSHPGRIPDQVLDAVDGYEALNARAGHFDVATAAVGETDWARLATKAALANSDAHFASEIGRAYTRITGPPTFENVRRAILNRETTLGGDRSSSRGFFYSQVIKMVKTGDPSMLVRLARKAAQKFSPRG